MNSGGITIREAKPEDAPILAEAEREIAKTPGRLVLLKRVAKSND